MTRHLRIATAIIVSTALLVAFAGAGLGLAMPAPEAGDPGASALDTQPVPAPLIAPEALSVSQIIAEPVPAELRADEARHWVSKALENVPDQEEDPWAAIDACVLDDMAGDENTAADDTPAASIAVAVDGVITYTKGYGVKDVTQGGEVDANTLFRIGSTTKMMTAAAIMRLADEGQVELDTPITEYLPQYQLGHPWNADDLTLHLLMSHQSGMLDQYHVSNIRMPLLDWVEATGSYSLPLYAAPGTFWNYANPNFSLAGAVAETVSQTSLNEYLSLHIWEPAGMALTTLDSTEVISNGNYATGYHYGQPMGPADYDLPMLGPAGTAFSTPSELVTWALLMQSEGDDVITEQAKQLMQERHVSLGYTPWSDYGYGVMVTDWQDAGDPSQRVTVFGHGGNINGGSSAYYWVPDRGVVVSILASTIRSLDYAAICAVETLAGIEPIPTEGHTTEPESWEDFVGTYSMLDVLMWPWTGRVRRVTDTLRLSFNDIYGSAMLMGGDMRLYNAYFDTFGAGGPSLLVPQGVEFAFMRDADQPSRVRYMRNRNLVGERVGHFPDRVDLEGEACSTMAFSAALDMPELSIRASGLESPLAAFTSPLTADDPSDPASSSITRTFSIGAQGADLVYVLADTEPDDAVGLYLMGDSNGDGEFSYPDEFIASGVGTAGITMLYVPDGLPPGEYELSVHGAYVNGENSVVSVEMMAPYGEHLRLENVPSELADGTDWQMQVCAQSVEGLDEPATGVIQFEYGRPPRLFRTMVRWTPSEEPEPPPAVYLPLTMRGFTLP